MKQFLEEEQKSRKELERLVRKLAKQKNDCSWDDSGHWTGTQSIIFIVWWPRLCGFLHVSRPASGEKCLCGLFESFFFTFVHLCHVFTFQPHIDFWISELFSLLISELDGTFSWNLNYLPDPVLLNKTPKKEKKCFLPNGS